MAWRRRSWFGQTRRGIRALERIAAGVETQNALLTRLADLWAPLPGDPADPTETSQTSLTDREHALLLDYRDRVERATGQLPTEEDCWTYLAEIKAREAMRS